MPNTPWSATSENLDQDFHNWSGGLRFRPSRVEVPGSEEDVAALVRAAARQGRTIRPIGSAHSSSALFVTDDILVSLDHIRGLREHDARRHLATVGSGSELTHLSKELEAAGLTLSNFGDVATQTVGGAIGTGTHGSGRGLYNLSMMLIGGRLVTARGEIRTFGIEEEPDFLRAFRVSFGTLGILTWATLQLDPLHDLHRQEWCLAFEPCMEALEQLARENRNFDFYWYPRSDEVKLRCINPPGEEKDYSAFARLAKDEIGSPHEVIPQHSDLPYRFEEMEYCVPAEAGPTCLRTLRGRIKERWRRSVGWRLLYRYIKGDDTWLSEAHGRDSVSISLHQNASLPYWDFFLDLEPILRDHGGRPHWAKKHSLRAPELRALYPMWDRFLALRQEMDPEGRFLTPYLRGLLGC
ncbi:L-gulono-1,4-lactone dehydrogenase [Ensifer psoraleae]|uniref:D-arabinono-1,4-lactone oxidase n=1 Tax=Sinorhizobium psoraleae TaxID=520838 RepID=UPI001569E75C|nr:D-arabinono-1,4-lactone oxidase [Sinorhizobium psoraleae]NRP74274.1 L-gulono-1,4-lactone dehydrogenase [Sinorhizobium psoraleae]